MSSQLTDSGKISISIMVMFGLLFWLFYTIVLGLIGMKVGESGQYSHGAMSFAICSLLALSLLALSYLLFIGKQRRYERLSRRPWRWYLLANCVMFCSTFLLVSFFWAFFSGELNLEVGDSIYLAAVEAGLLLIPVVPFSIAATIYVILSRALTIEVHRAYFTKAERNDDFRLQLLRSGDVYPAVPDDDLLESVRVRSAKSRLFFITRCWSESSAFDETFIDTLREYYEEPLVLSKMRKHSCAHWAPATQQRGYMDDSRYHGDASLQVPAQFDLRRIEDDLLRYRLDQGFITTYVQVLLLRFKSAQQRKAIEELFRHIDLVVTFNEKVYAARASKGKLSLLQLEDAIRQRELEVKLAQLDTQLDKERNRKNEQPPPITPDLSPDERFAIRKEAIRREVTEQEEIKEIVARIKRSSQQKELMRNTDALHELIERQTEELARIDDNETLGPTGRREARRKAEEIFIKQLEKFERGL